MMNLGSRFLSLSLTTTALVAQGPTVTTTTQPMLGTAILVARQQLRMDALVDVNHDGKMDAIGFWTTGGNAYEGALSALINDGTGKLTPNLLQTGVKIGLNNPTPDVFLGDWNGDSEPDFGLDQRNGTFSFFVTTPSGPTIATQITLPITGTVTGVVGADFNDDGKADIAILTTNQLSIFLNSNGYPQTLGFQRTGGGSELRLVDVDNDGDDDLVHLVNRNEVQLLEVHRKAGWNSQRADTVTNVKLFKTGSNSYLHPACGDIDGDQDHDVVLFGSSGVYQVLRQESAGTFRQEQWVRGGPATAFADIDADGDLDGICCGGGGGSSGRGNYGRSMFEVAINVNGVFQPSFRYPNIGARHIAGAADMNGDGTVDLVAGRGILFQRGQLRAPVLTNIVGPNRSGTGIRGIADYDGDGDMDLDNDWLTRDHYRNPGDGKLQMISPELPAPPTGSSWGYNLHYRGDWDGDGDLDLIIPILYSADMWWLRNEDGVRYSSGGPITPSGDSLHPFYRTTAHQSAYFAHDLDGDGLDDLITYDYRSASRTFFNKGNGQFVESSQHIRETIWGFRDLNGDSYPDAIARVSGGAILVFWGSSTGTFSPKQTVTNLPDAISIDFADYDGDGNAELFSIEKTGVSGTQLRMHIPTANGLVSHTLLTDLSSYARVHARDLDGDGRMDLFVTPASGWDSDTVITLRQTPGGGFEWSEQMMMEKSFRLGDMDGDGDLDVVGNLAMLSNVTHHAPDSGRMQQFGVPTEGTSGLRPQLGATGPFRPGHDSSLILRHGIPNAYAVLVAGVQETNLIDFPWINTNTYVAPALFEALVQLDAAGVYSVSALLPPGVANSTILYQTYVLDPSSPAGFVSTNGIRVHYGK